jgi:branched-subunit amino acid aminotransferase/4-amino-4-deoxychorismate lyase
MSGPLAYLNGKLLPRDEARLSIHDAGLVFGAAVTDFCRTFRHRLYRWPDHLARFRNDCSICFIPLPQDENELTSIACELVAHNARLIEPHQELALVSFATPGPFGFYGGNPGHDGPATLCMHTAVLPFERYRWFFADGIALDVPGEHGYSPIDLAPPRVKHRSRLHWWRADRITRMRSQSTPGPPLRIAILIDNGGNLTETAIGNLLLVRDGTVVTPEVGVLDSISLRVVEEICVQLDIPFSPRQGLRLADCAAASEAMLCGSAFCLAGVRWIAGQDIPWSGPITQRLLAAWSDRVGIDIAAQFLSAP